MTRLDPPETGSELSTLVGFLVEGLFEGFPVDGLFVGVNVGTLVGLRVGRDAETQGLDLTGHGEAGYNVAFGGTSQ